MFESFLLLASCVELEKRLGWSWGLWPCHAHSKQVHARRPVESELRETLLVLGVSSTNQAEAAWGRAMRPKHQLLALPSSLVYYLMSSGLARAITIRPCLQTNRLNAGLSPPRV